MLLTVGRSKDGRKFADPRGGASRQMVRKSRFRFNIRPSGPCHAMSSRSTAAAIRSSLRS